LAIRWGRSRPHGRIRITASTYRAGMRSFNSSIHVCPSQWYGSISTCMVLSTNSPVPCSSIARLSRLVPSWRRALLRRRQRVARHSRTALRHRQRRSPPVRVLNVQLRRTARGPIPFELNIRCSGTSCTGLYYCSKLPYWNWNTDWNGRNCLYEC
jgi:hypothetical protein